MRIGILAGSLALLHAATWPIYAQVNSLRVSVSCPDLSREQLAQVMVMARAGLLTEPYHIKQVRLTCGAEAIAIEMDGRKGERLSAHEPKALLPRDIAEQLIALVDRLGTLARKWDKDGNPDASLAKDKSATANPPVPGSKEVTASGTNGDAQAAARSAQSGTSNSTPSLDSAATRKARTPRPLPTINPAASVRLSGSIAPRRSASGGRTSRKSALGIVAGGELAPINAGMRALLGPRMGAAWDLNDGMRLSAILGMHFGIDPAWDFAVTDYRAGLYMTAPVHPLFVATAGVAATLLYVRAPNGINQDHDTSLTPAAQLALAYRRQFSHIGFELGPTATFYARPRAIRVNGNEIFSVPILLVGVIAQTTIGI